MRGRVRAAAKSAAHGRGNPSPRRAPVVGRLAVLVLLFSALGVAANPRSEYSRRVWRVHDGLPHNRVQAIAQTPEGYLWIGTSGGLVRFDGARFVVFDRSSTPAMRDDSILSLYPSRDGSLWIGTEGGGLLHYRNGAFDVFGAKEGLTNGFVRALHEDSAGRLWVGTDRGFFRFDNGRLVRLDGRPDLPYVAVLSIREDRERRLWVGSSSGLLQMSERLMPVDGPREPVRSILEARDGTLWIAAGSTVRQLRDGHWQIVPQRNTQRINSLIEDHAHNLWIATSGDGLIRSGSSASYMEARTVLAIFEDREENLWVGTQDGLSRLSKSSVRNLGGAGGLPEDSVVSVYQDRGGQIWVATETAGLYRMMGEKAVRYPLPKGVDVRTLVQDRTGAYWFGSTLRGVLRFDGRSLTEYRMRDGLRSLSVRDFLEDREGNLWVATGSGLSRWDRDRFVTLYVEDGLAYGSVRSLAELRNGDLIVGTDGGVNRMRGGKFVHDTVLASLGPEKVWAILEDADGSLWLGTRGGGLCRIKRGRVAKFTTRDGLPSNTIYQLLDEGNGRIWMSSPAGVFSANRKEMDAVADGAAESLAVASYGTADGGESSQMNGGAQPAGLRTASGTLWFPGVKGPVVIEPDQLPTGRAAPVIVESIAADDRPLEISDSIVRIPPGRGKLEIHYTICNLQSPESAAFRYILEGNDEGWTATGRRSVNYTNLPPGRYRFRVAAGGSETAMNILWEPHFYQTTWFYAVAALLAGLAGWAGLRMYDRQTQARYDLLLAERNRLAREMHDTVIQGCVGVSTLLEAAATAPEERGARDLLDRAREQVRVTLDEARQAVWNLRHDSERESVVGALDDIARQISRERGIRVETEVDGEPAPIESDAGRNLVLLAREAVRNAAAHANPTRIAIRLSFAPREVRLEIIDNGCGFDPAAAEAGANGHYGIMGMRERVEQLGGSLHIASGPGKGTRVVATVPRGAL